MVINPVCWLSRSCACCRHVVCAVGREHSPADTRDTHKVLAMRMAGTLPREFTQNFAPNLSKSQRRRDIDRIPGFMDSRPKQQPSDMSKGVKLHASGHYGHRNTLHLQRPKMMSNRYDEYGYDMPSVIAIDQNTQTFQACSRALDVHLSSSQRHRLADVAQVLIRMFLLGRTYASDSNNNCQAPPGYSGCRRVNSNTVSGRAEFKRPRTSGPGGRDSGGGGGGGGSGRNGGDDQHDRHGSDRVHTPGGRFRCPVYGKASNKTKNNCYLERFETEQEALEHALQRHEWCPICKKERIDTRTDHRSTDLEKLFFENMKNLRFHVLRHHLKVVRCPHAGCEKTFGLLNAFSRDGHANAHYPAEEDKDRLKTLLERDFSSAERILQSENPALFGLFDGVRKCKSREELEQFLYRDGVKVFDNEGDVDNISPPKSNGISTPWDHGSPSQRALSQIPPGTPHTPTLEYPDTPVPGHQEFAGFQSISNDVSHAGGRFSPFSHTIDHNFLSSDQPVAAHLLYPPVGAPILPEMFPSHEGNIMMNRMLALGGGEYPTLSATGTDGFSQLYDHAFHMASLWEKADLSERRALFKTMSYFFISIHDFVGRNIDVVKDIQPADYPSQTTVADSAFGDSIVHSYGGSPGPRLQHSF
ncbi:hypothetical protein BZA05DRAFT_393659 [Tricharina praecox]|uniref:uncharacterized protein n=1 Tax=Tricharina praecox TaxID=43433 RepID=UPI00221F9DF4|nr:uncharacterized protein BZA05DRAFT_393659 [Tricharina praecox]KAI5854250.1 hypothetical protein BZA05DRAFT_393659 [Tricharina praecox]